MPEMRRSLHGLCLAVVILLGSCRADDGAGNTPDASSLCGFATGGSDVTTSLGIACAGCSIENAAAAADNNLDTSAKVVVTDIPENSGATIRVTATNGAVFPAGRTVGYWAQDSGFWCTSLRTYLNGSLQEELPGLCDAQTFKGDNFRSKSGGAGLTSQSFDAVEFGIIGDATFYVQQICSDL